MPGSSRFGKGDVVALLGLVGTALVVSLPILRGGFLTYIDNSVHLAEVYELARHGTDAWSEIGFAGFPLGNLHSPLFYPALAALVRAGVPLEPVYTALLVLGLLAPPLAIYVVARRRTAAAGAALLAYLALVQPPMLWGIGSPLGGMWTHALASGMLVLLADLYARPSLTPALHVVASALLALAVLTHLFVLPVVLFLVVITTALHLRAGTITRSDLTTRSAGWALAGVASAKYWLTFLWVGRGDAPLQLFRPLSLLLRLLAPADPMLLADTRVRESIRYDAFLTDALPMLAVVGLGLFGFFRKRAAQDTLGQSGFWLAASLLVALVVHAYVPLVFLGPVSWRLVDWVRLGLVFSAIAPVAALRLDELFDHRPGRLLAALAMAPLLGFAWSAPLRLDCPPSLQEEVADARHLWSWLRDNGRKDWGRVYVADTFGLDWEAGGLAESHLLALTSYYTGLPQLGTYYGIVPYKLRWTLSEFNAPFGARPPTREWLLEAMEKTNAGVFVASNPEMADLVAATGDFERLHGVGRYTVFRRMGAENRPIAELSPSNHVGAVDYAAGDFRFDVRTEYASSRVLLKTGYHAWWHLEGIPGAWLRESPEGFLVIDDIPSGHFEPHVWYAPSPLPGRVTALGWLLLVAWGVRARFPSFRRPSVGSAPA